VDECELKITDTLNKTAQSIDAGIAALNQKEKVLKTRLSERVDPDKVHSKNLIFPRTDELCFENPINGLKARFGYWFGFNYLMKNGVDSKYTHGCDM
jgi:hypothetical protein